MSPKTPQFARTCISQRHFKVPNANFERFVIFKFKATDSDRLIGASARRFEKASINTPDLCRQLEY